MSSYNVILTRSAQKELESLNPQMVKKIFAKIENLTVHPRPTGCVKLQGHNELWRIRVGDFRIIYSIDDKHHIVDVNCIRHRRDAYK